MFLTFFSASLFHGTCFIPAIQSLLIHSCKYISFSELIPLVSFQRVYFTHFISANVFHKAFFSSVLLSFNPFPARLFHLFHFSESKSFNTFQHSYLRAQRPYLIFAKAFHFYFLLAGLFQSNKLILPISFQGTYLTYFVAKISCHNKYKGLHVRYLLAGFCHNHHFVSFGVVINLSNVILKKKRKL